jgi:hypothetical protein
MFIDLLTGDRQLQSPKTPETSYDPTAAAQNPSTVLIEDAATSESTKVVHSEKLH